VLLRPRTRLWTWVGLDFGLGLGTVGFFGAESGFGSGSMGLDPGLCSDPGLFLDLDRDADAVLVSSPTSVGSLSSTVADSLVLPVSAVVLPVSSLSSVSSLLSTVVTESLTAMVSRRVPRAWWLQSVVGIPLWSFLGWFRFFGASPAASASPVMPSMGSRILKEMGFTTGIHPSKPLTLALPLSADSFEIEVVLSLFPC
jgi:hypothetical protein